MKYGYIDWCSLNNGTGIRVALFVSGCTHGCENCFNENSWDFNYGSEYTKEVQNSILDKLKDKYIKGLSILGGEPLNPKNIKTVTKLIKEAKKIGKSIYLWTGYTSEHVLHNCSEIVELCDLIVTEKYVDKLSLKNNPLIGKSMYYLRGSINQKFIVKGQLLTKLDRDSGL